MPWCEECAKYWAPSAMSEAGECPTCGRVIDRPTRARVTAKNLDLKRLASGQPNDTDAAEVHDAEEISGAPWHFKLLMVMLVLYLGWRVVDLFM